MSVPYACTCSELLSLLDDVRSTKDVQKLLKKKNFDAQINDADKWDTHVLREEMHTTGAENKRFQPKASQSHRDYSDDVVAPKRIYNNSTQESASGVILLPAGHASQQSAHGGDAEFVHQTAPNYPDDTTSPISADSNTVRITTAIVQILALSTSTTLKLSALRKRVDLAVAGIRV